MPQMGFVQRLRRRLAGVLSRVIEGSGHLARRHPQRAGGALQFPKVSEDFFSIHGRAADLKPVSVDESSTCVRHALQLACRARSA